MVTELSIFWPGNGVEIKIFVHPINFFFIFSSFDVRLFSIMLQ